MKEKDGFGIAKGVSSFTVEDELKSCLLKEMEKEENKSLMNKSRLKKYED
jgi:hypothetical protein